MLIQLILSILALALLSSPPGYVVVVVHAAEIDIVPFTVHQRLDQYRNLARTAQSGKGTGLGVFGRHAHPQDTAPLAIDNGGQCPGNQQPCDFQDYCAEVCCGFGTGVGCLFGYYCIPQGCCPEGETCVPKTPSQTPTIPSLQTSTIPPPPPPPPLPPPSPLTPQLETVVTLTFTEDFLFTRTLFLPDPGACTCNPVAPAGAGISIRVTETVTVTETQTQTVAGFPVFERVREARSEARRGAKIGEIRWKRQGDAGDADDGERKGWVNLRRRDEGWPWVEALWRRLWELLGGRDW